MHSVGRGTRWNFGDTRRSLDERCSRLVKLVRSVAIPSGALWRDWAELSTAALSDKLLLEKVLRFCFLGDDERILECEQGRTRWVVMHWPGGTMIGRNDGFVSGGEV
jgi:hypothetical protein